MKLLHINASYKPAYIYGGPALSVSRLCESLVNAGADLEVFTTTANGTEELKVNTNQQTEVDGVSVTYFKRLTKDHTHFSPGLLRGLSRWLREDDGARNKDGKRGKDKEGQKIEDGNGGTGNKLVHIHVWWNLVSVLSCFIAKRRKVPVVLTPRGTLSNYSFGNRNSGIKDYIHRFLGKSLLEYCHFHVTSEKEKKDLLKLIKPKSVTVIPNFVYLPVWEKQEARVKNQEARAKNQEARAESREPRAESLEIREEVAAVQLLFLSRIEEKKGIDILFKALADLSIPYKLTLAGTGEADYIQYLQNLANELKISPYIRWVGQQSQEEKWSIMQNHDLMVLPSHDENFANVVIECLSTGTPLLISNMVGLADYIERNDFGWICNLNPESIRDEIMSFINQQDKAIRIREKAPLQIRADFDEKVLVSHFLEMYSQIINHS